MKGLTQIQLKEFAKDNCPLYSFDNEIMVIEMNGQNRGVFELVNNTPVRINALCIILICKGELEIMVDYISFQLQGASILDITQKHTIQYIDVSDNFIGYQLLVSEEFIKDTFNNEKSLPLKFVISNRVEPLLRLGNEDMKLFTGIIQKIKEKIEDTSHIYQKPLIINELSNFLLELGNTIHTKFKYYSISVKISPQEEIVKQFFNLINYHCKEQHEVSFYAKQLCISPEYLSRIMKMTTGKPANKVIANALVMEAKIMLRNPEVTIQQIADHLNFSDQSSFGKFFKRNLGMSPLEYRNRKNHYF